MDCAGPGQLGEVLAIDYAPEQLVREQRVVADNAPRFCQRFTLASLRGHVCELTISDLIRRVGEGMTMLQRTTLVVAGCLLLTATAHAAPFTAGDLAVFQASSATANNTTASIVAIDTVTASQAARQTIAIGSGYRFSGSATSTG